MILTPRPVTVADLGVAPGPPRSDSIHVSALIHNLCVALEPERFSGNLNHNRVELGSTVERMIEDAWASRRIEVMRPGEITLDGITGSPDGLSFDDQGIVVEEIKCTWMSSQGAPEHRKFWHWLVQIKAYCTLVGTTYGRLHAFFVNGNYADQREPQYLCWDLEFTPEELAENWVMLRNAK